MKLNINKLQEVLKKATLNYVIPSAQLKIGPDTVSVRMKHNNNVVICLDLPNDCIENLVDEIEFNFDEPNMKVKPYLNLIDEDVVDCTITDDKVSIKNGRQRTNLHFCMPAFVGVFTGDEPNLPPFFNLPMTDDVFSVFNKIKKVAGKFEKVYFEVKDNILSVETTDKTNNFSNGISFELGTIDHEDVVLCFDFKHFNAVLQCLDNDLSNFTIDIAWVKEQNIGVLIFKNTDNNERFYLISIIEE